jgi:hypothetical protein
MSQPNYLAFAQDPQLAFQKKLSNVRFTKLFFLLISRLTTNK